MCWSTHNRTPICRPPPWRQACRRKIVDVFLGRQTAFDALHVRRRFGEDTPDVGTVAGRLAGKRVKGKHQYRMAAGDGEPILGRTAFLRRYASGPHRSPLAPGFHARRGPPRSTRDDRRPTSARRRFPCGSMATRWKPDGLTRMAQPDLRPFQRRGRPALVLIAEDEPEIAEILTAYLARGGLRTVHGRRPPRTGTAPAAQARPRAARRADAARRRLEGARRNPSSRRHARDHADRARPGHRQAHRPAHRRRRLRGEAVQSRRSRRACAGGAPFDGRLQEEQRVLRVAPFEIDLERHEATLEVGSERHTLVLTLTEFKLLAQLARARARSAAPS